MIRYAKLNKERTMQFILMLCICGILGFILPSPFDVLITLFIFVGFMEDCYEKPEHTGGWCSNSPLG